MIVSREPHHTTEHIGYYLLASLRPHVRRSIR